MFSPLIGPLSISRFLSPPNRTFFDSDAQLSKNSDFTSYVEPLQRKEPDVTSEIMSQKTPSRFSLKEDASLNFTLGASRLANSMFSSISNTPLKTVTSSPKLDSSQVAINSAQLSACRPVPKRVHHLAAPAYHQSKAVLILPNSDYYTNPPLDKLRTMTQEELSKVPDFEIGCKGLGSIKFEGPTDLSHTRLDAVVQFHPQKVTMFPNDMAKPPVGEGLNKPAVVTLENCFPKKRTAGILAKYAAKIEQTTRSFPGSLRSWDPDTGKWIFSVEHF